MARKLNTRGNKFNAKPTHYNGIKYDSKREADRARELDMLLHAGVINNLRRQVKYELIPPQKDPETNKTIRAVTYTTDFVYERDGQTIIEDVKGVLTRDYKLKKKLMLWRHGIMIQEV